MKPEAIGKAYDQITHRWEGSEFDRQNGILQHKRALGFLKQAAGSQESSNGLVLALDVGCGCTGRFIDLFIDNGLTPEGVDISKKMFLLAKEKHPNITFYHQDICQWEIPKKYHFITAWDSIWHIPLEQHEPVLTKLVERLHPGGVLIFSFGGIDAPDQHCNRVMGPEVYYSSLGVNGFLELFVQLGVLCRHLEYDQYPESHAYLVVQKRD